MTLAITQADPLPLVHAIHAEADVLEVDEGHGFCASVMVTPRGAPVARLDRSLAGAAHEGAVLRWAMLHTTGAFGLGYFVYRLNE